MIIDYVVIGLGILISHFLNGSNIFEISNVFNPDFMILFVAFFSLRKGAMFGLWIGFFGGLLTDTGLGFDISADGKESFIVGLHSLVFALTGYIVGKTRGIYNEHYFSTSFYNFIITILSRVFVFMIFGLFFHWNKNYSFVSTSLYNAAISPMVFFILSQLYNLHSEDKR